jgi:hypothetical protein
VVHHIILLCMLVGAGVGDAVKFWEYSITIIVPCAIETNTAMYLNVSIKSDGILVRCIRVRSAWTSLYVEVICYGIDTMDAGVQ